MGNVFKKKTNGWSQVTRIRRERMKIALLNHTALNAIRSDKSICSVTTRWFRSIYIYIFFQRFFLGAQLLKIVKKSARSGERLVPRTPPHARALVIYSNKYPIKPIPCVCINNYSTERRAVLRRNSLRTDYARSIRTCCGVYVPRELCMK